MTPAEAPRVRVLLVEDETPIAMLLEDMLDDLGYAVHDNACNMSEALECVARGGFDVALLDVNLAGERVYPVAEALQARGIPFAFASGYGPGALPREFAGRPVVGKPFSQADLATVLSTALGGGPPR